MLPFNKWKTFIQINLRIKETYNLFIITYMEKSTIYNSVALDL